MTGLLEFRERLRSIYGRFELYIVPGMRFVLALVTFLVINNTLGYMKRLASPAVPLALALVCTFLPVGYVATLGAILILLQLFALSLEAGAVGTLLFLLMFFMYFSFVPKGSFSTVLSPLLCQIHIPQAMPTALGLGAKPHHAIAMACGMVAYYFLKAVKVSEALLGVAEKDEDGILSRFSTLLHTFLENREMYLVILASVLTTLAVYVIRRQSIVHAWAIAIGVGNVLNLGILLAGSFLLDIRGDILWYVLGTAVAVAVGFVMQFFQFHLNYPRTERVQFEDDEYYYYVKAVPKVYVKSRETRVKQINSRNINKKELAEELEVSQELLDDLH